MSLWEFQWDPQAARKMRSCCGMLSCYGTPACCGVLSCCGTLSCCETCCWIHSRCGMRSCCGGTWSLVWNEMFERTFGMTERILREMIWRGRRMGTEGGRKGRGYEGHFGRGSLSKMSLARHRHVRNGGTGSRLDPV